MTDEKKSCFCIRVYGLVQGVGFRPFVARLAEEMGISGSVSNRGTYVEILSDLDEKSAGSLIENIKKGAPERAMISRVESFIAGKKRGFSNFIIEESSLDGGVPYISPDISICKRCTAELFDKTNRRYLHPFINCTDCGPRLTIMEAFPYDRERTSMKKFPMCDVCRDEYFSPASIRYDAQPVCCADCGPKVYIPGTDICDARAVEKTREVLISGGIAAVKGIGGFHLCCLASNEAAVRELRGRKKRPSKPFAVMAASIEAASREVFLSETEKKILDGPQKPILLCEKRPGGSVCELAAPKNPRLGIFLPYTPLHMLLFGERVMTGMGREEGDFDTLIMTSGNAGGAPICTSDEEALSELSGFCDIILSNNRRIVLQADDSVAQVYGGDIYMIRRSRGYSPLPVYLPVENGRQVLAAGGELKNSYCLSKDGYLFMSPYLGDMEDLRTVRKAEEGWKHMEKLLDTVPECVVCDMHPGYNSSALADERGLPVKKLQHHYAHILSCMAENGRTGPVLGMALDGTGFGDDGGIWGGELLLADMHGYERLGHIRPFLQTGGDASAKEGFRVAADMLTELFGERAEEIFCGLLLGSRMDFRLLAAARRRGGVVSTSAGRLFDAVSAVLGLSRTSSYEGEAACALQFAAEKYEKENGDLKIREVLKKHCEITEPSAEDGIIINTDRLFRHMVEERLAGKAAGELALSFHIFFAAAFAGAAAKAIEENCGGEKMPVALSGGCFQNTLLLQYMEGFLKKAGLDVMHHHAFPPGDGGLALGQAAWGMANAHI